MLKPASNSQTVLINGPLPDKAVNKASAGPQYQVRLRAVHLCFVLCVMFVPMWYGSVWRTLAVVSKWYSVHFGVVDLKSGSNTVCSMVVSQFHKP